MARDPLDSGPDSVGQATGATVAADALGQERTLGQLVASATQDLQKIIRSEVQLAKAEITGTLGHVKKGVPMLVIAGVLALYALGFLFTALERGLERLGLPAWAAYLIVAVFLLVVAGIVGLVGKNAVAKVQPKPERTIANAEATIATIKHQD